MTSLYLLIPLSLVFLALVIAALVWAVGSGQYDDLERQGQSILFDDDLEPRAPTKNLQATGSKPENQQAKGVEAAEADTGIVPEQADRDR